MLLERGLRGLCILAVASQVCAHIKPENILWGKAGPPVAVGRQQNGPPEANPEDTVESTPEPPPESSSEVAPEADIKPDEEPAQEPAEEPTEEPVEKPAEEPIAEGEQDPDPTFESEATPTERAGPSCTNGPGTRGCWSPGFSIDTDFDAEWPTTGVTVTYDLELTGGTCDPDGSGPQPCQVFNGQYPGPLIEANWGDYIQVNVKNSLTDNGTALHFHGMRMLNNCPTDGVPGITECPLAPGDTKTYTFQATQFGSTWYHSHWSIQYGDGTFGPLVINGPASADYDVDLGAYTISDLYYGSAYEVGIQSHDNLQIDKPPPFPDNIIINGTNKNKEGKGEYNQVRIEKGKKYRLRIINGSTDNSIRVSLDGHTLQVITSDLIPIVPYYTDWVLTAPGQRYDVIIEANQTVDNYWFRADAAFDCYCLNKGPGGRSIFIYDGASGEDPKTSASKIPNWGCNEESPLVPWVPNVVEGGEEQFTSQAVNLQFDLTREGVSTNGENVVLWGVNMSAINVDWSKPTLEYIQEGNLDFPPELNVVAVPAPDTWTYWIIQETPGTEVPIPHPIHLHGHDFYVLGRGKGVFDIKESPKTLTYDNPTRRDTAILPGGGWLVLAFPADNPGAWIMHCHIAYHVSDGLAVQFIEGIEQMPLGDEQWQQQCDNWRTYALTAPYPKLDSGV
ncbi:multicopper oxidase [Aaosphaeria arxii CBS 175.79]|uniref:laccase n=1 Tax=Aaosphaeria arxii CBS 175.79 TaxID=1450172 RepID=A0A6A5Y6P9_9PLEO|nr:multicopper oxidase [Aaosphaeria arxii CBS 175.79]KAF2020697.1 multicopper oxidase [Aaosphaeria arxii CBS 175.79]